MDSVRGHVRERGIQLLLNTMVSSPALPCVVCAKHAKTALISTLNRLRRVRSSGERPHLALESVRKRISFLFGDETLIRKHHIGVSLF